MNDDVLEANDVQTFRMIFPLLSELAQGEDVSYPDIDAATLSFLEARKYGYKQLYIQEGGLAIGTIGLRLFYDPMCIKPGCIVNNFIVKKITGAVRPPKNF
jgi:hypothetical protein